MKVVRVAASTGLVSAARRYTITCDATVQSHRAAAPMLDIGLMHASDVQIV